MNRLAHRLRTPVGRGVLCLWIAMTLLVGIANVRAYAQDPKPDSGGSTTGKAADLKDGGGNLFVPADPPTDTKDATYADKKKAKDEYDTQAKTEPLAVKLAESVGNTQVAVNYSWLLITGFLVMFMQAGFAMVEAGFCRAKNAAHVIMTNFMIYPLGMLGFFIAGFAIMFGSVSNVAVNGIGGPAALGGLPLLNGGELSIFGFGIAGMKGFGLGSGVYDVGIYAFFLFQMVFMDTTATIPTGAMAERWRFSAFMVYGFFVSIIAYPIYGHMVWGGGGLATLGLKHGLGHGTVDFAGSSVVHAVGGFVGLAGAIVLGPRLGKYTNKKPNAMPGHHIPMAIIGTFILAFGWFGFNPGSMFGIAGGGNLRTAIVAVNTMIASAGGAFAAIMYMKAKTGKFDPAMAVNGMLAGLVAITAPCAFTSALWSLVIGVVAGLLVILSIFFWENRGIDDPVGAISVHGVCGVWGLLSVGIFSDGSYGAGWNGIGATDYMGTAGKGVSGLIVGDTSQFIAQVVGAVVCVLWAFVSAFIFFKVQKMVMPLRPTPEEEMMGLDIPEMGMLAYPDFQQLDATSPSTAQRTL